MPVHPLRSGIQVWSGGPEGVRAAQAACRLVAATSLVSVGTKQPLVRLLAGRGVLHLPQVPVGSRFVVLNVVDPVRWRDGSGTALEAPQTATQPSGRDGHPIVLVDAAEGHWAACEAAVFQNESEARATAVLARQHFILDVDGDAVLFLDMHQDDLLHEDVDAWGHKYDRTSRTFGTAPPNGYEDYADTLPDTDSAIQVAAWMSGRLADSAADARRAEIRVNNAPPPAPSKPIIPDPRVAVIAFMALAQAEDVRANLANVFVATSVPSGRDGEVAFMLRHLPEPSTVDELTERLYKALRTIEDVAGEGAVDSVRWPDEA